MRCGVQIGGQRWTSRLAPNITERLLPHSGNHTTQTLSLMHITYHTCVEKAEHSE